MKINLSPAVKFLLVFLCLVFSVAGFMVKLPSAFRHFDKELHTVFYFLAAAFLNLLFAGRNVVRHLLFFVMLYGFGMMIEYAQEYSNKFFHVRIHGRYDPEDLQANVKGLIAFSALWLTYVFLRFLFTAAPAEKVSESK